MIKLVEAVKRFPARPALLMMVLSWLMGYGQAVAQVYPPGFGRELVAGGLTNPTTMAFTPDGRILVCEQAGSVRVVRDGTLLAAPFLQLAVNSSGERGLIGIALDPDFETNQYVYVYYTVNTAPLRNRITRFTADGDVALADSETIILELDNLSNATNHNGGAIQFGPDDKLYVAIGDNATGANAQNMDTYHGKFLRVNKDGSVPADNPFTDGSEKKKRIWAYGLRNPFTFDIQPGTGRIYVNDVGQVTWEEINDATIGGLNFGWPAEEGDPDNPGSEKPIFAYPHGSGDGRGCAITGGTFLNPETTSYPDEYHVKYFFQDYCNGWIGYIDPSSEAPVRTPFATGLGSFCLGLTTGNDGNLYYLSRTDKALYRIVYTLFNDAPVAMINTPGPHSTYAAGTLLAFSGVATDEQDGELAEEAFNWDIILRSDEYIYDRMSFAGTRSGEFQIPDEGITPVDVFYRIVLTAVDSEGVEAKDSVDIFPRKATITFHTDPEGLQLLLDDQPFTAPNPVVGIVGMKRMIGVVSPQEVGGTEYYFDHWIHGGEDSQVIVTPENDATFTATFSIVLGVEETIEKSKIKVFPNPLRAENKYIEVSIASTGSQTAGIYLVDLLSRRIDSHEGMLAEGENNIFIDAETLGNGVYGLVIKVGKERKTVKLLISR